MKTKEVTVSYGETIAGKNYSSQKVLLSETVDLDINDDPETTRDSIFRKLRRQAKQLLGEQ